MAEKLESFEDLLKRTYFQACDEVLKENRPNGVLIKALQITKEKQDFNNFENLKKEKEEKSFKFEMKEKMKKNI